MEFNFPKWTNKFRDVLGVLTLGGLVYLVFFAYYGGHPKTLNVGYAPEQPVPYSHALHAGELGIDCMYCHNTVEKTAAASVPATETCMNCHAKIRPESPRLTLVRESYASGEPIEWIRIHDLPDYVYFNHSAHVNAGVGCVSCHGRIDTMEVVRQEEPLHMNWCLECHRNPEPNLRPVDKVTAMDWTPSEDPEVLGARLRAEHNINPRVDCSTCHR